MTTYKARTEVKFILPVAVMLLVFAAITIYNRVWFGFAIIIVLAFLITHIVLTTYYQIENRILRIKSGFLFNKTITVDSIRKIAGAGNIQGSGTTSAGRLEIMYNKNDSIFISPTDHAGFIKELKTINPGIEISQYLPV